MSDKLVGMYIHMHWGYNHPYAARTWTFDDWRGYLTGLRGLGFNLVQIWPMLDTMPLPLTPSDRAHLEKLGQVIDMAHGLGMRVHVGASANTIGNAQAADYPFETRPYFTAARRLNPGDNGEVAELMAARRVFMEPLAQADGFWIIDSDPGGYPGSTPAEFAELFEAHRTMLDGLRPGVELLYWMWQGWADDFDGSGGWGDSPQPCWREALERLIEIDPEPWGIEACWKGHFALTEALGLRDKTIYYPYGAIESEPSFPFTDWNPPRLQETFACIPAEQRPRGVLGNAQSHCLQLPHTYLFRHLAAGGDAGTVDLAAFGERIAPGLGEAVAQAWPALASDDSGGMANALAALPSGRAQELGDLAGLCFNQVDRLVADLRSQLELRAAVCLLRDDVEAHRDVAGSLEAMVPLLDEWASRHGFSDWCLGSFIESVLEPLREMASRDESGELTGVLDAFSHENPHGATSRLIAGLREFVADGIQFCRG
jgi:hypothetical protein